LLYVVRTGALWRGNIGKADISILFNSDPRQRSDPPFQEITSDHNTVFTTTYPGQARWVSDKEVHWHFNDWNPKEDIVVQLLIWKGTNEHLYTYFDLPSNYNYKGLIQKYTNNYLELLVEDLVSPWKNIFPEQTKTTDRKKLKKVCAELLYYEVLARHGLYDDKYFKWYYTYLEHARYLWYKPDKNKTMKDVLEELNENERHNLEFLKQYF